MSFIGNLIWFLTGGFLMGLGWCIAGLLWCISIVGVPVGIQCFKFATMSFCPFGKDVIPSGKTSSFLLNVLWILISGVELCFAHLIIGIILCITVVGIPFGKQHFKLAQLALLPFGSSIR